MTAAGPLAWDGCVNVRDLGGHRTEDGRETRHGAVVRADSAAQLTQAGWDALTAYGVTRIVDLRLEDEVADDPPRDHGVEVVHVPLTDPVALGDEWADLTAAADAAPDAVAAYVVFYGGILDLCAPRLADAVEAVADAPPGGVVIHCAAGKDRTGLVSAILLRLCRVPLEAIDADYALTEANLAGLFDDWLAEAGDDAERRRRVRMLLAPNGAMAATLAALEQEHGSVEAYLEHGGLAPGHAERVRSRLLAPP